MRYCFMIGFLSVAAFGQSADNPQIASSKGVYEYIKGNVLKAADKMPDSKYGYRPTDSVRSYGQVLAHIADSQFGLCGIARDGKPGSPKGFEKTATTKPEIIKALNEGFAYCDAAYSGLTDATSAEIVDLHGRKLTKLALFTVNTAHVFEHYGNLVTYMRMNDVVPPTSEQRPPAAEPKK